VAKASTRAQEALNQIEEMKEAETKVKEVQSKLHQFCLGQATISCSDKGVILKGRGDNQDDYKITGPVIEKHEFNPRPTLEANVKRFLEVTKDGLLLRPFDPSHLVKIFVKGSEVEPSTIGELGGKLFPDLAFKPLIDEPCFKMGNGHHRYLAQYRRFESVIKSFEECEKIVRKAKTKEMETTELKTAREKRKKMLDILYEQCKWGAQVYDLGMYFHS